MKNETCFRPDRRRFLFRSRDFPAELRERFGHPGGQARGFGGIEEIVKMFNALQWILNLEFFVFGTKNGELMRLEAWIQIVGNPGEPSDSEDGDEETSGDEEKTKTHVYISILEKGPTHQ